MNLFIALVDPQKLLLTIIAVVGDRILLLSWAPVRYPNRCRLEKVVRGKALHRTEFDALTQLVPIILSPYYKGKTRKEWMETEGKSMEAPENAQAIIDGLMSPMVDS